MEDKVSKKETGMSQLLKRGRERKGRNTCEGCDFESTKEMKFTQNLAKKLIFSCPQHHTNKTPVKK